MANLITLGDLAIAPHSPDFLNDDIKNFLARAPGAGADFKCGADFMRYRARQELWRLKDKLLNSNPPPAEPQFCYAQPFVVDLSLPAKSVDVYGYDLDQMPLEMFVMNSAGFFEDVTFALTRKSHFHLVFDLGNKKLKLSGKNQTLALVWGHLVRYSIALIQPTTPLCLSAIETIPSGKALSYQPPVISGDGRFGSAGARVWANAVLDYESNKVDATFCLTAADPKEGGTVVAGCAVEYVYTSDPDHVIEAVFGGLQSRIAYSAGAPPADVEGAREGPVARWSFEGMDGQSTGIAAGNCSSARSSGRLDRARELCFSHCVFGGKTKQGTQCQHNKKTRSAVNKD